MKRFATLLVVLGLLVSASTLTAAELTDQMKQDGWVSIFDGKTLDGWKSNEKYEGFKVEDGCIVGFGNRNHLYYMQELKNFELMLDVKISKGGNGGVYIKSQWQDENWPTTGFELQVNSSHTDPVKTGSLYNIIKLFKAPHGDDEWFTYHIVCRNSTLEVRVNGELLYIYEDPMGNFGRRRGNAPSNANATPRPVTEQSKRISQSGYIAIQQHDPKSVPTIKNVFLKKLAD